MNTKEKLFEIALNLFSEKGFNATSIRAITKEAGVSVSAFYNHFKSKDELLAQLYDHYTSVYFNNNDSAQDYNEILDKIGPIGLFEFIQQSITASLNNEKIARLSRIISMEQYINKTAYEITKKDKKILLDSTEQIFISMKNKNMIDVENPSLIGKIIGYAYLGFASDNTHYSIIDGENPEDIIKEQSDIIMEYLRSVLVKKDKN